MAQRSVTSLIDDLTGMELDEDAGETVMFALDGVNYEIDLERKGAAKLRSAFQPYVDAGRRLVGSRSRQVRRVRTTTDPAAVRAWAASNGVKVSDRGRIPAGVVAQFEAAGN